MPKRFLIAAAPGILALTAPPLVAQAPEQHGGGGGQGHEAQRGGGQSHGPEPGGGRGAGGEHAQAPARTEQRAAPEQARPQHQAAQRMAPSAQSMAHPGPNAGPNFGHNRGGAAVMQSGRSSFHQNLRRNVRAPRQFSAGPFHPPRGFAQRRWRYGQVLPYAYCGRRYRISNYTAYGLFD